MEQLYYDLYFKLTDIKFWFDCLDDKTRIQITLLIIMILILIFWWFTCWMF